MGTRYFLRGRFLGEADASPKWRDEDLVGIHGRVLVCPTCGEAWGRVESSVPGDFLVERSGCPAHPFLDPVGGTFLLPWRTQQLGELPPEVLAHECNIRLQHHFKE